LDQVVTRMVQWAGTQPAVTGLVLYGSAALGRAHSHSDADVLVEFDPAVRDAWWARREQLAAAFLGAVPVFTRELPWQRDHRFQAMSAELVGLDLTFDTRPLRPPVTVRSGYRVLLDRGDLAERLARVVTEPEPGPVGADAGLEDDFWVWLLGLHGQLRHGRTWKVYAELVRVLANRVAPLAGPPGEQPDGPDVAATLEPAIPRSAQRRELARALAETGELYRRLWAVRNPDAPGESVLSANVRAVLRGP